MIPTVLMVLILNQSSFAGVTGKVTGVIKDKNTVDTLIGANVVVEGTTRGAAADDKGRYVIINMPPGSYTLIVRMMGYQTTKVTNVKVYSDRITTVYCNLKMTILEGEEVTIVAGRELIEFDRTNSAAYVSNKDIDAEPVHTLSERNQLQAGVFRYAG